MRCEGDEAKARDTSLPAHGRENIFQPSGASFHTKRRQKLLKKRQEAETSKAFLDKMSDMIKEEQPIAGQEHAEGSEDSSSAVRRRSSFEGRESKRQRQSQCNYCNFFPSQQHLQQPPPPQAQATSSCPLFPSNTHTCCCSTVTQCSLKKFFQQEPRHG